MKAIMAQRAGGPVGLVRQSRDALPQCGKRVQMRLEPSLPGGQDGDADAVVGHRGHIDLPGLRVR